MSLLSTCRYFRGVAEFRGFASLEGSLLWRVSTFNGSLLSELYGILYAIKGMLHLARYIRCLRNSLRFSTQIRLLSVNFSFTYREVTNSRNFLVYRTLATKMTQCKSLITQPKVSKVVESGKGKINWERHARSLCIFLRRGERAAVHMLSSRSTLPEIRDKMAIARAH